VLRRRSDIVVDPASAAEPADEGYRMAVAGALSLQAGTDTGGFCGTRGGFRSTSASAGASAALVLTTGSGADGALVTHQSAYGRWTRRYATSYDISDTSASGAGW
jgi:hypothetical protein